MKPPVICEYIRITRFEKSPSVLRHWFCNPVSLYICEFQIVGRHPLGKFFCNRQRIFLMLKSPQRDPKRVNCYVYYAVVIFLAILFHHLWHLILVLSGSNKKYFMMTKDGDETETELFVKYIIELCVGLYFVICIRSLKIKFQNEELPMSTVVTFQNCMDESEVTSPLAIQFTTVKQ